MAATDLHGTSNAQRSPASTVRDCVFDVMRSFGGNVIFGNPGSTELPMFRDFPADFRYVLGLQEAVAVAMADGYAQATRQVAFVNLHSAAGVGNAMGNIYTAHKNRAPLVIIAGQQARAILPFDPFLASEHAPELPRPHIKWSVEPARAEDVPLAIATACHRALQAPCGPVLVSVPSDDWDRPAAPVVHRTVSRLLRPDPALLDDVASRLSRSRRPAFVVGAEVERDGAWSDLVRLAELHSAAVYTAPFCGRGTFPEDHRLFMGFLPAAREALVKQLAPHDFVLVVGAPVFTYHVEGEGPHLPEGADLCQLTEDAASAARSAVGLSVVGSVGLALRDLLSAGAAVDRELPPPRPRAPVQEPGEPIGVAYLLQTLAAVRSPDDIVVEEAPTARVVMHVHLPILRPETFYTTASGGLGYSMPAAAGIALARPGRRVIGLIGDGSSMYSIQALWSAVQWKLDVTYIVINNGRYAAMKRFGGVLGFKPGAELPGTDLPGLDFVSLARGHGCPAARVTDAHELRAALKEALDTKGPFLLDVIVA